MKRKVKVQFSVGAVLLSLFILFTMTLKFVDVKPIGPQESCVAYAGINETVHRSFGVNMTLYNITDWAGVVVILIALGFAVLGLLQWIRRKSILKVDSNILILGVYYIIVFAAYIYFESHVVNYRPVLINDVLETSYPSSTTMLAACILPTAMLQLHRRIRKKGIRATVNILCGLLMLFMVIGRLICGVHWFTDIVGGLIFSAAMISFYCAADNFIR